LYIVKHNSTTYSLVRLQATPGTGCFYRLQEISLTNGQISMLKKIDIGNWDGTQRKHRIHRLERNIAYTEIAYTADHHCNTRQGIKRC
jgi:hypothetical protein